MGRGVALRGGDSRQRQTSVDAARFLREIPNGLVLVSDDQLAAFARAVMDIGLSVREIWAMDGINYSKGRRTRLALFEQVPAAGS